MPDRDSRARNLYVSEDNERSRQRIVYTPLRPSGSSLFHDYASHGIVLTGVLLGVSFAAIFLASSNYVREWAVSRHLPSRSLEQDMSHSAAQLSEAHEPTDPGNFTAEEKRISNKTRQDLVDAATELVGVKPVVALWQVATDGPVLVRKTPSLRAGICARKPGGTMVLGTREGDYVRLLAERGYMKIYLHERNLTLMTPMDVSFRQIFWGTCRSQGTFQVVDRMTCQGAGVALGMTYNAVRFESNTGCQLHSAYTALHSNVSKHSSLCCIESCEPPTSTTTTLTVTTTTSTSVTNTTTSSTSVTETSTTSTSLTQTSITSTANPLSLFCFAVVRTMSVEVSLLRNAYQFNVSIFACSEWIVYSDLATWITNPSRIETVAIPGPPSQYNGLWLNCPVFFRAWEKLLQAGRYEKYEWIAKVDPDTVFLPNRLQAQLRTGSLDSRSKVYFRNCRQFRSMQGPLELFSRGAILAFSRGFTDCQAAINQSFIGEDGFMQHCMDRLNVTPVFQFHILADSYCEQRVMCNDATKAAYHPFKSEEAYSKCLSETGVFVHDALTIGNTQ